MRLLVLLCCLLRDQPAECRSDVACPCGGPETFRILDDRRAAIAAEIGTQLWRSTEEIQFSQSGAALECPVADARDAAWDRHTLQTGATKECRIADARDAARNRYGGQATAAIECRTPDARDAARNRHAL